MMFRAICSGFFACLLASTAAQAQSLLAPMFQDHAVLQRDRPLHVYGHAAAGTGVTVRLAGGVASANADSSGHWDATLPALPAGGPYTLEARSDAGAMQTVSDVLVGDVFLCTGQSNMQLNLARAGNGDMETRSAHDGQVREMTIERVASPLPLDTFQKPTPWIVESPDTAGNFSASCFFMARDLRKTQKVPVGLVVAAWGGTRDRGWVSEPSLRRLGYYNDDLDMFDLNRSDPAAASHRWDATWESWWHAHGKGEPWKRSDAAWPVAPEGLGPWGDWPGLALPDGTAEPGVGFVGQMWLSTHVILTAEQAAKPATLDLGVATEEEKTWVNGIGVGGTSIQPRALHALPAGLLHAGDNSITVNIFCSWKNCGLSGATDTRAIRFGDGSAAVLGQPWRYQPVADLIAPQLPWGPFHGVAQQYNGMIAPIGPYGFKGAIWYQGESNIYFARHYQATVAAMMADWRAQFGAEMPFVIVQIPDYGPVPTRPVDSLWSDVREAQRRAVAADRHAGLVVSFDIGDPKLLHPLNKQEMGRRIALAARHTFYGDDAAPTGPLPVDAWRSKDGVVVRFTSLSGGLAAFNGAPNAFELCDRSCHFAVARISGETVVLAGAAQAGRVRYCWGDSPICTLTDASGLPATPFELPIAKK